MLQTLHSLVNSNTRGIHLTYRLKIRLLNWHRVVNTLLPLKVSKKLRLTLILTITYAKLHTMILNTDRLMNLHVSKHLPLQVNKMKLNSSKNNYRQLILLVARTTQLVKRLTVTFLTQVWVYLQHLIKINIFNRQEPQYNATNRTTAQHS